MILGKKVRIKPTEEQKIQLWKSVGIARWAYNWTLKKNRVLIEKVDWVKKSEQLQIEDMK